jgi:hypothetical protein
MTEAEQQAYDRGHDAGGFNERLGGHDKHFESINGQLSKIFTQLEVMSLEVQRQGDRANAAAATVIATATALEKAEIARRAADEQKWTPATRLYLVLGIIAAIVGLLAYLR